MLFFASLIALSPQGQLTQAQAKAAFSQAIANSDGAKLYSVLSPNEIRGVTAKACSDFLLLVTKPSLPNLGVYDQQGNKIGILDPKCPLTYKFRETGGADMEVLNNRTYIFEPVVAKFSTGYKATTGFADLAFWASHNMVRSEKGTLNRAIASHKLVLSWVPKFKKMGITGSVEPESKKFMTWDETMKSSQQEIDKMRSGGGFRI
ncbi:MAG: hypothetical protein GC165_10485 [Armatimonadetes bacterium]|nr:hypothetical protein [Armatimonadota bacterium]